MSLRRSKTNRLILIAICGAVFAGAVALTSMALNEQIALFKTPSDIKRDIEDKAIAAGQKLRIGGMVQAGSWQKDGTKHQFVVMDDNAQISVTYEGILPDLFGACQGVVITGALADDLSFAAEPNGVLAKHDENYVPKELAETQMEQAAKRCEVSKSES